MAFYYRQLTNKEVFRLRRMKRLRLKMCVPQDVFAQCLGVTKRTVGRWEQFAGTTPRIGTWGRFQRLETKVEQILADPDNIGREIDFTK